MIIKKFLFLILVLFIFAGATHARDNYCNAGIVFYNQKNYKQAQKYFYKAIKANPENVQAIYYFANTLVKLKNPDNARKYYKRVVEIDPHTEEAYYAQQAIYDIDQYKADLNFPFRTADVIDWELYNSENSYINNLNKSETVIRWQKDIMPLYVYINPSDYKEFNKISWRAFKQWQSSSSGFVTFEEVDKEEKANIIVKWNKYPAENEYKDLFGYALPEYEENELKHYVIYLNERNNEGELFLPKEMLMHTLHQIGHALGINSHSDNEKDIMYVDGNEGKLTRRDISTLFLLYNIEADVSNFTETRKEDIPEKRKKVTTSEEDSKTPESSVSGEEEAPEKEKSK